MVSWKSQPLRNPLPGVSTEGDFVAADHYNNTIGPEIHGPRKTRKSGRGLMAVLFILALLMTPAISTQFFAYKVNYAEWLGTPLYENIYSPAAIFTWAKEYGAYYGEDLKLSFMVGFYCSVVPFMLILIVWSVKTGNRLKGNQYLHGSARWAEKDDIQRAGLLPYDVSPLHKLLVQKYHADRFHIGSFRPVKKLPKSLAPEGVFVGAWEEPKTRRLRYLRHNGPEHVLCVAPTRSGKGVGLVNPTLLTWPHSTFVSDLKGELWELTAGWRQKYANNKVIKFEPAAKRVPVDAAKGIYSCSRWNPLDEIRSEGSIIKRYDYKKKKLMDVRCNGENEIADVQNICTMIVDPEGKGLEDHWAKTAFALLVGCVIHLKHNLPERCNIHTLDLMLSGQIDTAAIRAGKPGEQINIKNLWADMKKGLDRDGKPYKAREAVMTAGSDMYDRPDEEAGSVLSSAKSFLSLYRDPIVAENTSASDFKIKEVMNSDQPVSLYVVTQPSDKLRLKPLVRLIVNLMITLNADRIEFEGGRSVQGYAHRCLLMLDEFPSLGKLDIVQEAIAFMAGYGLKGYFITQDMAQLYTIYGKDESISSNCHVQVFYAPLRTDTAEIMSKKVGTTTIVRENVSISGTGFKASKSRSMQETARPLLTVDECMQLPAPTKDPQGNITKAGDMLIFVAGFPAIYGIQPLYFQNSVLMARAKIPAPPGSDILKHFSGAITEDDLLAPQNDSQKDDKSHEKN